MIKKIDWYIAKKFLVTFLVTVMLFVIIIIVFDVAEKLDDFFEHNAPIKGIIFTYYFNFVPNLINTFSPIFIFITVLYFTSRLASRSEFISILAGGVSLKRIMAPYIGVAFLLALLSYTLNSWIIPVTDKSRVKFEYEFLRDYYSQSKPTIYRQLKPGLILYMEYFNNRDSTGVGVNIEQYNGTKLQSNLFGRFIRWNKEKKTWRLENAHIRTFLPNGNQTIKNMPNLDTMLQFNANDFFFKMEDIQSLNNKELRDFLAKEIVRGSENINALSTEYHRRFAMPFSAFILVIIGVAVAGRKSRGGLGLSFAIGIFVIIFYLFFQKYFLSMGQAGVMAPWLGAWASNFIFIPVALIFYLYAQK